jgi:hypothetical protein
VKALAVKKTAEIVLVTIFLGSSSLMFSACGEETPCEKMQAIQKDICRNADKCFPCVCILRNEEPVWRERMGAPDIANSSCDDLGPCEGAYREWAEGCLELGRQEEGDDLYQEWINLECDPRAKYGIWLFDDNETYNPALPEVCAGGWGVDLHGIWGYGPENVWAAGSSGVILHWDGVEWVLEHKVKSGKAHFYDVWGVSGSYVWAVGTHIVSFGIGI